MPTRLLLCVLMSGSLAACKHEVASPRPLAREVPEVPEVRVEEPATEVAPSPVDEAAAPDFSKPVSSSGSVASGYLDAGLPEEVPESEDRIGIGSYGQLGPPEIDTPKVVRMGPPRKTTKIHYGKATSTGGVDAGISRNTVKFHDNELRSCWTAEAPKGWARAKLALTIEIAEDTQVVAVVVEPPQGAEALARCVEDQIADWKFGRITGAGSLALDVEFVNSEAY
ncbi:hypothetical protein ACNOYE_34955 [Nannocystaceae bacterium ST9]